METQQERLKALLDRRRLSGLPHAQLEAADIVDAALEKFIRQEIESGLKQALRDVLKQDRGGFSEDSDNRGDKKTGAISAVTQAQVDQMVAEALTRGRMTSSVLRTLFGIVPSLIGR